MRKTRRKARRVSDMNTFHDSSVQFLANRDRGFEFVKNFPPTYTSVFPHGSGDSVIGESSDYSVKLYGGEDTTILLGGSFSQFLNGCFTNVDHRMHYFVNLIHNPMRLEFMWVSLEVISRRGGEAWLMLVR
jgi:hypothetical protein